jgi:hypothetical protein
VVPEVQVPAQQVPRPLAHSPQPLPPERQKQHELTELMELTE